MTFRVPEKFRVRTGPGRPYASYGNNGAFFITSLKFNRALSVIASDGESWEHVSVSTYDRCPTWEEMCHVRNLFWDPDDVVIQIHPAQENYVNNHPFKLHLWRKAGTNNFVELPPLCLI